ncbi:hypothetical protein ABIF29_000274 [Bradyrhizobium elkanii]|jgi:hypothetical protein|uniref:Uncharacterized protein n=1 Tax=Bradyrhizobium elkanii TaxID=29448 RepID=A0ABV4EQR7_BRAEL
MQHTNVQVRASSRHHRTDRLPRVARRPRRSSARRKPDHSSCRRERVTSIFCVRPGYDDVVHERAAIVEVGAANAPGKQALCALHRSHDEAALARHQWHALGPTSRDIDPGQRLYERASYRCAAMRHHVDLAEPRRRIVPVVERPDRHFTAHRRIKPDPPALTAGRGDLGLDQQAINRGWQCQYRCEPRLSKDGSVVVRTCRAPLLAPSPISAHL